MDSVLKRNPRFIYADATDIDLYKLELNEGLDPLQMLRIMLNEDFFSYYQWDEVELDIIPEDDESDEESIYRVCIEAEHWYNDHQALIERRFRREFQRIPNGYFIYNIEESLRTRPFRRYVRLELVKDEHKGY